MQCQVSTDDDSVNFSPQLLDLEETRNLQKEDKDTASMINYLQAGTLPDDDKMAHCIVMES